MYRKILSLSLATILCIILAVPVFSVTDTSNKTIIRVGYIDYDNFIEKKNGKFTGYGVDYLNEISKYTNVEYQYVHGNFSDLLIKLKNKDIDLLCTAQRNSERDAIYDFSRHPFGIEQGVMYTRNDNENLYFDDYKNFDGKTIGFLKGSLNIEMFRDYARIHNFDYVEKEYLNEKKLSTALNSKEIDIIATQNIAHHSDLKLIGKYGSEPYYLITWKGNSAMDGINRALSEIYAENPYFEVQLYNKYYGNEEAKEVNFTREETEYIKTSPTLRVAFNSGIKPMAYTENGSSKLIGITPSILDLISEKSGLKFEYVPLYGQSKKYEYDYFRQQSIDLIGSIEVNEFNENIKGLTLTKEYFTATKVLVGRQGEEISRKGNHKLAIVGGSGTLQYVIKKEFPNYKVISYETIEECLEAVRHKDADLLFFNQYLLEKYLVRPQYENLVIIPGIELDEKNALSPVNYDGEDSQRNERLSDPCLISILNKTISAISESERSTIVIRYTTAQKNILSLGDVIYKFRYPFTTMLVLVIAIIALLLAFSIVRQKNLKEMDKKNRELAFATDQANHANDVKSRFLAQVSHEIRTPMNAIIGLTEISKNDIDSHDKMIEHLVKIENSSKLLLGIINDVLDMSAIESNKLKISNEPFDFKQLLLTTTSIYYSQCKQKNINFDVKLLDITEEVLIGDSLRLNQIMLNLLSNSVKFTESGGRIDVTISQTIKKDSQVFIKFIVSDTGCGMSEDMLERIFKPFEQENSMTANKYGGSGLGLSITKNLVDMMRGSINVTSQVNKGTTFTVELPFGIGTQDKKAITKNSKKLKALIVDDDEETRLYTAAVLGRMGIPHDCAQSGEDALMMLGDAEDKGECYNVCFMDWKMPDMDGIETARQIREIFDDDTIIIIVSAYDICEIEEFGRKAGANYFVSKPLFQSTVFDIVMKIGANQSVKPTAQPGKYNLSGHRILIAEDAELNMEVAVSLLKMVGAEIDCAVNGQIAVDKFITSQPGTYDIILMDIHMPILDGYQATKKIRESAHKEAKSIPIYAMTANAFTEDVAEALASGMNGHIAKPIDTNVLYSTLQEVFLEKEEKEKKDEQI